MSPANNLLTLGGDTKVSINTGPSINTSLNSGFLFILNLYNGLCLFVFSISAIDVAEHFTLNRSRAEDITLTEDYESNILLWDRNFGERS